MIKKTAVLLMVLLPLGARAQDEHLFSDQGRQKRLGLTLIGLGGATAAVGGVFFFVGRAGAGLHQDPDGTLLPMGDPAEVRAAVGLQRVAGVIFVAGVATVVAGTITLLLSREGRRGMNLVPALFPGGATLLLVGTW